MISGLVSFFSNAIVGKNNNVTPTTAVARRNTTNPFANPFMAEQGFRSSTYAQNKPVQGGYFAGYYNGKANIVGQKLFIEV